MPRCLICGEENALPLCESCERKTNIKKLCEDIIYYNTFNGENALWNSIIEKMRSEKNFRYIAFDIASRLPSPDKELVRIRCIAGTDQSIPQKSKEWFLSLFDDTFRSPSLTERDRILLLVYKLTLHFYAYEYPEAEETAKKLMSYERLSQLAYSRLADFFTKTRRYAVTDELIKKCLAEYPGDFKAENMMKHAEEENEKRRSAAAAGRKEYVPNREENKKKYADFLHSIGVEIAPLKKSRPEKIPEDQYPQTREITDSGFDSFVAYDVETTGFSAKIDEIVEIGAVKVINGEVKESETFTFREFVKPFEKKISAEAQAVHGITQETVENARRIWDVFPDFADFIGDNVLIGYNNIKFDAKFLRRAGRHANVIITNDQFDVLKYAESIKAAAGLSGSLKLEELAKQLDIADPVSHRALADAVTTARVFLKLRQITVNNQTASADDLGDPDNW